MDHLSTFFAMGGYAAFVWPAYGVAALVLVIFAVDSWRRVKVAEEALRRFDGQQQTTARRVKAGEIMKAGEMKSEGARAGASARGMQEGRGTPEGRAAQEDGAAR
jgi:heme exporter protein D